MDTGVLAQRPIFIVSVPVHRNGEVVAVVSAGAGLERLSGLFAEAGLGADWVAAIIDRNGTLMARSRSAALYLGKPVRADAVALA